MATTLDSKVEQKLATLESRHEELARSLADPEFISDMTKYRAATKSFSELERVVAKYREYRKAAADCAGARELLAAADDAEMRAMAQDEVKTLEETLARLSEELKILLLPSDPNDAKNVVLEIRAGTGGDEATLFAAEIFRMYSRFAESQGWKVETTELSESEAGGIKEAIAIIEGDRVYSRLKFE